MFVYLCPSCFTFTSSTSLCAVLPRASPIGNLPSLVYTFLSLSLTLSLSLSVSPSLALSLSLSLSLFSVLLRALVKRHLHRYELKPQMQRVPSTNLLGVTYVVVRSFLVGPSKMVSRRGT